MAEIWRDLIYQARQLFGLADMAREWDHTAANFSRHHVQRFLLAAANYGSRAFAREHRGDGFADAPASAGDNRDFSFELHLAGLSYSRSFAFIRG